MLTTIKMMMGITNNDFDDTINIYISSAKQDLLEVGIADTYVGNNVNDPMIQTAIISYVLSLLDVSNSDMYASSYQLQKDTLRHLETYTED